MRILKYGCGFADVDSIELCESCDISDHVDDVENWEVIDERDWERGDCCCSSDVCDYEYEFDGE